MKKIFISLLCVCIAFLAGCTSNNKIQEETTGTSTQKNTNVAETTIEATQLANQYYSTDKVVWGPGRADNHQRPADPVSLQETYGKLGSQFIMSDDKFVCLTFDEGYENGYTPAILDTLKEKSVKAIFFVTYDFVKDNPDLIERMIDEGHIIGNHTYRHYTMDEVSEETATEEIVYLDTFMKENFRYRMKLFRFPKGEFSENTLALANSLGYKSIFWSFAYADWDPDNQTDNETALKTIIDNTHNGEIMLLHAVSATNASILGDVIDKVREQGYEFTTEV